MFWPDRNRRRRQRETEERRRFVLQCAMFVLVFMLACGHCLFGLLVGAVRHVGDPTMGVVCAALGVFVVFVTYRATRSRHIIIRVAALLITSVAILFANAVLADAVL